MKKIIVFLVLFSQFIYAQELALVRKDGKFVYISKTGEFVIQPKYKAAKSFSEGLAAAEENGKWGFIKPDGQVLGNQWYENAENFQK